MDVMGSREFGFMSNYLCAALSVAPSLNKKPAQGCLKYTTERIRKSCLECHAGFGGKLHQSQLLMDESKTGWRLDL